MLSWFRKATPPPPTHPANPGSGVAASFAFTDGTRTWSETVNLLALLKVAMAGIGLKVSTRRDCLRLASGMVLVPQVASAELDENGRVQTTSTIQVSHPDLVPKGVFEYQHAVGASAAEVFSSGFKAFADLDLPVFLDGLASTPTTCTYMEMAFPAKAPQPALTRRAVLGPATRYTRSSSSESGADDEHCYCQCCFLTKNYEAFTALLSSDGVYGVRFFTMRDADGYLSADCRVNGEDYQAGAESLVRYGESWPGEGLEFRKQYVLLHTVKQGPDGA